jgi:hypothetical protein
MRIDDNAGGAAKVIATGTAHDCLMSSTWTVSIGAVAVEDVIGTPHRLTELQHKK